MGCLDLAPGAKGLFPELVGARSIHVGAEAAQVRPCGGRKVREIVLEDVYLADAVEVRDVGVCEDVYLIDAEKREADEHQDEQQGAEEGYGRFFGRLGFRQHDDRYEEDIAVVDDPDLLSVLDSLGNLEGDLLPCVGEGEYSFRSLAGLGAGYCNWFCCSYRRYTPGRVLRLAGA